MFSTVQTKFIAKLCADGMYRLYFVRTHSLTSRGRSSTNHSEEPESFNYFLDTLSTGVALSLELNTHNLTTLCYMKYQRLF